MVRKLADNATWKLVIVDVYEEPGPSNVPPEEQEGDVRYLWTVQ